MRIGLSGGGATIERVIEQAVEAEADGFSALWYSGAASADPLLPIAFAGRATTSIELGTSVVQTYPVHPLQMAQRALAVADAIGRPGLHAGCRSVARAGDRRHVRLLVRPRRRAHRGVRHRARRVAAR